MKLAGLFLALIMLASCSAPQQAVDYHDMVSYYADYEVGNKSVIYTSANFQDYEKNNILIAHIKADYESMIQRLEDTGSFMSSIQPTLMDEQYMSFVTTGMLFREAYSTPVEGCFGLVFDTERFERLDLSEFLQNKEDLFHKIRQGQFEAYGYLSTFEHEELIQELTERFFSLEEHKNDFYISDGGTNVTIILNGYPFAAGHYSTVTFSVDKI